MRKPKYLDKARRVARAERKGDFAVVKVSNSLYSGVGYCQGCGVVPNQYHRQDCPGFAKVVAS